MFGLGDKTMATPEEKYLSVIEKELRFIARHSQVIEGMGESDFETVDEICMAVNSALRALDEYRLSLLPTCVAAQEVVSLAA